ncbi:MAG: OmpA family protein [Bacteroidia bacterium]|jgi:outer membrane protein OmpA-like peptidoglycan-associated protein|nr:OmpA family protein [Bacteroidia bacterium]
MKKIHPILAAVFLITGITQLSAQTLGDRVLNNTKNTLERRVEQKVDKTVNKGVDKVENKVDSAAKGEKKKDKKGNNSSGNTDNSGNSGSGGNNSGGSSEPGKSSAPSLKTYGKYDFVPGEKVVVQEDFMQDAVGDFPAKWNTNGSGELVTIDGSTGHWLKVNKNGNYLPEFITELPENFTFEFDIVCNENFSFYSSGFNVNFVKMTKPGSEFVKWARFGDGEEGVRLYMHPTGAGNREGTTNVRVIHEGKELIKNELGTSQFAAHLGNNKVHVSVWRQKNRLRVYFNEEKVWDLPRAFQDGVKYNGIVFHNSDMNNSEDYYLLSNLRLAVGAPDTRSKLITEGKLVTRGIQFESGSDKVKAESYGTLKEIATVLKENPTVRVKIVGHTDSDGDDATNLDLSKRRAEAVKKALSTEFGIDASRLETDGKGESQPADANTTPAGKANNRRVEFIKL